MSSSSAAWISGSSSTIKTRCVWEPMVQCDSWNTNRKCATRPRANSHGVPWCRANGDRKRRYIFTDGCTGACITSRTFRMLEPSAMLARLDAATRDSHAELDAYWLDLMAQGVTADRYREQLMRVCGFEAPPERAHACTFLAAYDGVAAARWQQLGGALDAQAWKHGHEPFVAAARTAFTCARRWFSGTEPVVARGA